MDEKIRLPRLGNERRLSRSEHSILTGFISFLISSQKKGPPISPFLDVGADFIQQQYQAGNGPVLVHCAAGKSRSAAVVVAFLVKHRGFSLIDALVLVREKRPRAYPQLKVKKYLTRGISRKHSFGRSSANGRRVYAAWKWAHCRKNAFNFMPRGSKKENWKQTRENCCNLLVWGLERRRYVNFFFYRFAAELEEGKGGWIILPKSSD